MSVQRQPAELIGHALRTRLNRSHQDPSGRISRLLIELGRAFTRLTAKRPPLRESGQEIGNRLGLFAVGETVKRRIGIPGLRFLLPAALHPTGNEFEPSAKAR